MHDGTDVYVIVMFGLCNKFIQQLLSYQLKLCFLDCCNFKIHFSLYI